MRAARDRVVYCGRLTPWTFVCIAPGNYWLRVGNRPNGPGLAVRDHRRIRPLFSERYAGQHGVRPHRYYHLGHWCFTTLRRLP